MSMTKQVHRHRGRARSPTSRSTLGTTKFYKSKNTKRTIILMPIAMWRLAKDISLDNNETFTSFVLRGVQNEIDRQTKSPIGVDANE